MQFALTASELGHAVTLFEKEKNLGGQIPVAAGPPAKGELLHIRDGMAGRLLMRNVEIRCGRPLTVDDVKRGRPDVVVVATERSRSPSAFPAATSHVVDAWIYCGGCRPHREEGCHRRRQCGRLRDGNGS